MKVSFGSYTLDGADKYHLREAVELAMKALRAQGPGEDQHCMYVRLRKGVRLELLRRLLWGLKPNAETTKLVALRAKQSDFGRYKA